MNKLRVIGDVHGSISKRLRLPDVPSYIEIVDDLDADDYSVQVGDLGFDYSELSLLDPEQDKFFYGNHDNLDTYYDSPNALGDYGMVNLGPWGFFFVRGAISIDMESRKRVEAKGLGKCWWAGEELSYREAALCFEEYRDAKPDVVMSHDCPATISKMIGVPGILEAFGFKKDFVSQSQNLLEQMFIVHQPKLWIFGHYHKSHDFTYKGCRFMCLAEREYVDFNEKWVVV